MGINLPYSKKLDVLGVSHIENVTINFKNNQEFKQFCGVGTNKIKRRLGLLSINNKKAILYKKILEASMEEICEQKYYHRYIKLKYYNRKISCLFEIFRIARELKYDNGYTISDYVSSKKQCYFILNYEDLMHYIIEVDGYLFSWHCHTFEHNIAGLFIEKEKLFENKFENLEKIILKEFPEIKLHRYNRNRDI